MSTYLLQGMDWFDLNEPPLDFGNLDIGNGLDDEHVELVDESPDPDVGIDVDNVTSPGGVGEEGAEVAADGGASHGTAPRGNAAADVDGGAGEEGGAAAADGGASHATARGGSAAANVAGATGSVGGGPANGGASHANGSGGGGVTSNEAEASNEADIQHDMLYDPGEPYVGMTFDSMPLAKSYYNDYANRVGFSIKSNTSRRNTITKELEKQQFVCNKYKKPSDDEVPVEKLLNNWIADNASESDGDDINGVDEDGSKSCC